MLKTLALEQFKAQLTDAVVCVEVQPVMSPADGQAGGGAMGSSPAGAPASDGSEMNPLDIQTKAAELAQQWLQLPVGERQKQMAAVRTSNPNLHAMAKQKMEEMRSQAESQGRQSLSQPM